MTYRVKLPVFEGPLDLLLHLLERDEIDIWDIPIAHITDQYLAYLETMQEFDLAIGGEFLVMAATLMQLKARTLLPKAPVLTEGEDGDLDPIDELAVRLLEYRAFKEIAGVLEDRAEYWSRVVFRPKAERNLSVRYEKPVGDATVADLWRCFQQIVADRFDAVRVRQVRRREFNLKRKMGEILLQLRKGITLFSRLTSPRPSRDELVVTFLAVLELVRRGRVQAIQHGNFTDIQLKLCSTEGTESDVDDP